MLVPKYLNTSPAATVQNPDNWHNDKVLLDRAKGYSDHSQGWLRIFRQHQNILELPLNIATHINH